MIRNSFSICPFAVPCKTAAPKQQARTLSVRAAEAEPSCGALHPLRPLSGPCVLQTAAPKQQARTLSVRAAEAAPSCGALHPLRPLGGPRVLQTAAPKADFYTSSSVRFPFGQRQQRPLAVPCIRFGPWAGLASCRPLRQKSLPAAPFCRVATSSPGRGKSLLAGGGRDFSP